MDRFIVLMVILAFASYAKAQCGTNASGTSPNCLCLQGYYGTSADTGQTCAQCPTGTTTPTPAANVNTGGSVNIGACSQCAANYYMTAVASTTGSGQAATCSQCQNGSGNTGATSTGDPSACNQCQIGYYMNAVASAGTGGNAGTSALCTSCPANSSTNAAQTAVATIASCICFDINSIQLSATATYCTCKNGYSGVVTLTSGGSTGCFQCPSGQFSSGGSACTACASGSKISSDQGSCTCNDATTGTTAWSASTNVCQCQANYYGNPSTAAVGATNSCTACPNGTTSAAGSAQTSSDCSASATTSSKIIQAVTASLTILAFVV